MTYGIDAQQYKAIKKKTPKKRLSITFVGKTDRRKGLDLLAAALGRIKRKKQFLLKIVGADKGRFKKVEKDIRNVG